MLLLREGMLANKMDNVFNEKQTFHAIISCNDTPVCSPGLLPRIFNMKDPERL